MHDLDKAYERVEHKQLMMEGKKACDYPVSLLRVSVASYRSSRWIVHQGVFLPPLYPERGIITGATAATTELKLAMLRMVKQFVRRHAAVHLSTCIDDLTIDAQGKSSWETAHRAMEASNDLQAACESLGWVIALAKTVALANTK